jgi:hypothetical protein
MRRRNGDAYTYKKINIRNMKGVDLSVSTK